MISLSIHAQGDACWEDLQSRTEQLIWLNSGAGLAIARLPRGMASGRSSVAIRVDLPDGRVVVAETSMALFLACAGAFKAAEGADDDECAPVALSTPPLSDRQIAEVIGQRAAPPVDDGAALHDWVMSFARDLLERAGKQRAGNDGWPKLTRDAKVGNGRFGAGVSARLVVEAAQRQHEYEVTPEKEAERIAQKDRYLDRVFDLLLDSYQQTRALMLLDEVRRCFTRDDDLPDDLLPRIDEALRNQETSPAGVPAAARDVLTERRRQIEVKGWTPEHDDEHVNDEIAALACFYAMPPGARDWSARETGYGDTFGEAILPDGWTAEAGDRREELVKAGALILAEIERLDRAAAATDQAVDLPAGDPWTRDPESTQGLLTLVGLEPSLDTIATWTDEQCQQAEAWAAAAHVNASDNDDVVVPPRPAFLPKPWEGPVDNQWGNGPTQF